VTGPMGVEERRFQIHDPGTGRSYWVSEQQILTNTMQGGGYPGITAFENPQATRPDPGLSATGRSAPGGSEPLPVEHPLPGAAATPGVAPNEEVARQLSGKADRQATLAQLDPVALETLQTRGENLDKMTSGQFEKAVASAEKASIIDRLAANDEQ